MNAKRTKAPTDSLWGWEVRRSADSPCNSAVETARSGVSPDSPPIAWLDCQFAGGSPSLRQRIVAFRPYASVCNPENKTSVIPDATKAFSIYKTGVLFFFSVRYWWSWDWMKSDRTGSGPYLWTFNQQMMVLSGIWISLEKVSAVKRVISFRTFWVAILE